MELPFTASSRLPQSSTIGVRHGVGSDFQVSKPPGAMNGGEFCPSMKTTLHRLYMCVCTYICLSGIEKGKLRERERERERRLNLEEEKEAKVRVELYICKMKSFLGFIFKIPNNKMTLFWT